MPEGKCQLGFQSNPWLPSPLKHERNYSCNLYPDYLIATGGKISHTVCVSVGYFFSFFFLLRNRFSLSFMPDLITLFRAEMATLCIIGFPCEKFYDKTELLKNKNFMTWAKNISYNITKVIFIWRIIKHGERIEFGQLEVQHKNRVHKSLVKTKSYFFFFLWNQFQNN